MTRRAIPMILASMLTLGLALPVLAAAPSNDTYAGRTVIDAIPFSEELDTTEATTDADDVDINAECGAPATDASVWYELILPTDSNVQVDVSGSNYTAGVAVATGSPGNFSLVTCGPNGVAFPAVADESYVILVFDDQGDGTGIGGTLTIVVDEAPPPPTLDVTINPTGTFTKSGSATVSGTVLCEGGDFAVVDVQLRQRAGRVFIDGFGGVEVACDGTLQPWTVEVIGNGLYKGGKASASAFAFSCNAFSCAEGFAERSIMLRRR